MRKALDARLGRVVERLARAGRLGFPVGPLENWPEAELRRLDRMITAGGAVGRAALARLTDADLQWIVDSCPADEEAEAEEASAAAGVEIGPHRVL